MKKNKLIAILLICTFILSVPTFASNNINVIINGKVVNFNEETGYPFIDENNRTMVPLRVTMETAGAAVGYDTDKSTAIVITEHERIEIPIGTEILYNNNIEIQNDTKSVVKNGRTYLPIRAVLESAGFEVEWDANTNTVNAYTFSYDPNEFVPYSTSSLETLANNMLNGNVVYMNGEYYATPKYVKSLLNTQVHYLSDDLNKAIYPQESRFYPGEINSDNIEWIAGLTNFDKILVRESELDKNVKNVQKSEIPDHVYVYGFYDSGLFSLELIYVVDEMTDEFMNSLNGEGTFNGIRMKKEDGLLYFYYKDIKERNLIKE